MEAQQPVYVNYKLPGSEEWHRSVAHTLKTSVETITPEIADQYLQQRGPNRALSEATVKMYAHAMSAGQWQMNGDAVRFNHMGYLVDGQHRLEACRRAQCSFVSLVIRGLDPVAFDTIDIGRRRSHGDVFAIAGEQNTSVLAAALKLVACLLRAQAPLSQRGRHTPQDMTLLLDQHPTIRRSVRLAQQRHHARGLLSSSAYAAVHYCFAQKDAALAEEFVEYMNSGVGREEADPFVVLREKLIDNLSNKAKLSLDYLLAITIKAWNAKREGKTSLRVLVWRTTGTSPEAFPAIL